MSYTTDYTGLDPITAHNRAIRDIIDYMGQEKFDERTAELRKEQLTLEVFQLVVSFCGVRGYPAKAWFNYCYPL
jgi:hypothetical protein